MEEQNSLLRSAYQIAKRRGENTNWEAFANNLEHELVKQSEADAGDIGQILRSTCTYLTYRLPTDKQM